MFELGQRVRVRAEIATELEGLLLTWVGWALLHRPVSDVSMLGKDLKCLYRREVEPVIEGVIVGRTVVATGIMLFSANQDEQSYLAEDERHTVWMVARSLKCHVPILALAKDIEVMEEPND